MKLRIIPYGKWWQHLLKLNLYMAYRAVFGWKRAGSYHSSLILDNFGFRYEVE
jgi:hypothetical protein